MDDKTIDYGETAPMINFVRTDDIVKDLCGIIESSREAAYKAVNTALIQRNWLIGCRIAEEGFQGEVLPKLIYIAFICFTKSIRIFSTH